MCKKVDGFVHLELEDVNPQKKYHRSGYAYYKADVDANAACKAITHTKIDNFEFFLSVHTTTNLTRSNTVDPGFSTLERKVHDHKQAIELVCLLFSVGVFPLIAFALLKSTGHPLGQGKEHLTVVCHTHPQKYQFDRGLLAVGSAHCVPAKCALF